MELKKTLIMPKGKFPMRANLPSWEPNMAKEWNDSDLYEQLLKAHDGKKPFYIHDGPPYANNEIHAGHALNKILKDIINRSKNLEGYYVPYTPGWDCHGLPIEREITKSGVDIKTTPAPEFRNKCHEYALGQVKRQKEQMLGLGVIGDYKHPYLTLNKEYEAHQIEIFADMALKGLIYKGLKPVNWSWSSESALAEAEIEYHDVTAKTIYVRFPVIKGNEFVHEGDYIMIWTTTPWTIPSNMGLCVNAKMTYALYETDKGNLVMLKDLASSLKDIVGFTTFNFIREFTGKDIEGVVTKHPYIDRESPVCCDDYVTADGGTGIVHLGPGHGADDYRVAKKYGLPIVCTVDAKGYMTKDCPIVEGMFYEDCNEKILEILANNGTLLKEVDVVHAYPHDWRTKKPTIFRATDQWFCSIDKIKDQLVAEADKVNFIPAWGKDRLKAMLAGRDDWCISRQRLWGVPIPIFYGEDGEALLDKVLFDHVADLFRQYGSTIWYEKEAKDLLPAGYTSIHSPNGKFTKEKDIMDVWFDSGSSFLGSDIALGEPFPADIYFEGNDQYRGWYNSSMILSVATRGVTPYKNVLTHGFIVDQNGEKFSKSKKNGIDPQTICKTYGADILRLWATTIDYSMAEIKLTQDLLKVVSDQYRKIRNTFKFMLANLQDDDEGHGFDPHYVPTSLSYMNQLMMNKLNVVLTEMKRGYDTYAFNIVTDVLFNFLTNDLSASYLDFSKDTLYCDQKNSKERRDTQYVIYNIVKSLAIAYSPILCFTCEEIYRTLELTDKKYSIALEDYPNYGAVNADLTNDYETLLGLRYHLNVLIEAERKNGVIGSSSEAFVNYAPSEEEKELIEKLGNEEVARIVIVSGFAISNHNEVKKHTGEKCERCWNYFDVTMKDDEGHCVCPRCHKALFGE